MQEPASVIFSIANGYMHVRGIQGFRRRTSLKNPLRRLYLLWGFASVNTWIWSTIFHIRGAYGPFIVTREFPKLTLFCSPADKPWSERMDYFSAALGITYSLFLAIVRIWHLYPTPSRPTYSVSFRRVAFIAASAYFCHVVYLSSLERFDCASPSSLLHLPPRLADQSLIMVELQMPTTSSTMQQSASRTTSSGCSGLSPPPFPSRKPSPNPTCLQQPSQATSQRTVRTSGYQPS